LISNYSGTGTAQTLSPAITVSPNTNYTISGWVYVFKGSNPGRACIDLNGISGSPQLCTTTTMSQLSAWKYLSGTWNSGSNTSVTVRLLTDSNPYTTWFDDIRLSIEDGPTSTPVTPTTPSPTITNFSTARVESGVNSGFETVGSSAADAANWTEGTNHTRASDKFHTGGWSLHSTYRGTGIDTRTTAPIAVSPNTTYTYSGYIWRTNSTGAACMDMADIVGESQLCTSASGSWQFLSGTWNSGSNTSVSLRLITDGSPTGDIWFDDISLAGQVGPTTPTMTPSRTNTPTSTPVGLTNTPTRTPTKTPTPTITNTPSSGGNLVLNPGFETVGSSAADAANWSEGTNHTRASDKFHTGGWSLHSAFRGAGTSTNTADSIAVTPNTTYTYSGYIWRTNSTGSACMDMSDIVGERQLCTSASGSWQFLSGAWSSGSNTSVMLRLITDGSPTGDIWFDDISLAGPSGSTATPTNTAVGPTNTPSAGGNLVLNPGFETAGTSASDAANWTEGTNHTRASDKFHTGGWSLHSTYRGTGTDTRTTAPIAVSPNTTYTYSGYIWRTNATGAACMDMADMVGESQLCASTTGSWQFLSGTWDSGTNTSVSLRLITDGSPTGDIWFDDISLIASSSSANIPQQVHLSWTDTDGIVDTSTTMNVTWSTAETGDSIVKYGPSLSYGSQTTGTTTYSASLGIYMHSVKLTGLAPNQLYHYSVGSTASSYSGDFTFRTAPVKGTVGSYTIGLWSDTQNNAGNTTFGVTSGIVQKMIPYNPLFTLQWET
jgi:muramidase (phage lysozyme)